MGRFVFNHRYKKHLHTHHVIPCCQTTIIQIIVKVRHFKVSTILKTIK